MADRAEFERLFTAHVREAWAVAYARRPDADAAQDIAQEAFLRLWKAWQAGEAIRDPRAWLLRVARNLAEDEAKSAFRRNGTRPPELFGGIAAPARVDPVERAERDAALHAALAELPAADRELLALRYALDYDTPAIADVLGVSPEAVLMRLSRARRRVAELLGTEP